MKITVDEIKKTAVLAKMEITGQEAALYAQQLSAVLDWIGQLQAVDTSGADDMPGGAAQLRDDIPVLNPAAGDIAAAFNDKQDNLLKVKKVL